MTDYGDITPRTINHALKRLFQDSVVTRYAKTQKQLNNLARWRIDNMREEKPRRNRKKATGPRREANTIRIMDNIAEALINSVPVKGPEERKFYACIHVQPCVTGFIVSLDQNSYAVSNEACVRDIIDEYM